MRSALHSGLILALLISFSQAPHDHFHPGDSDHEHDHQAQPHDSGAFADEDHGPALHAPDHDSTAKLKDWLAGDGLAPSKLFTGAVSVASAPQLVVLERSLAVISLNNHDPPSIRFQPARAPPTPARL